jgi:FlaA1/EpsC-like NDP-sugar epimerase
MDFLRRKSTPRWLVFSVDVLIVLLSVQIAYQLRFNFSIPPSEVYWLPKVTLYVVALRAISFIIAKTYAGIIFYTSTQDARRIVRTVSAVSALFVITNLITYQTHKIYFIPFSIIIIEYLGTVFGLIVLRTLVKIVFNEVSNPSKYKSNVIVFGAGTAGVIAKRAIDRDGASRYKVFAFVDDDATLAGRKIEDVPIYNSDELPRLLSDNTIASVIISAQQITKERKADLIDTCLLHDVSVQTVPPVNLWINGQLSIGQIKNTNIEDLLEREEITIDYDAVSSQLSNKVILVTGAAGSIGSELVRQITRFHPKKLILFDQAESPLYDLEMELNDTFSGLDFEPVIGDVCDEVRLEKLFSAYKPTVVFHAAAYKHVPLMELNPTQAIEVNVRGTRLVADKAVEHNVERFILVSTDKAVNPTNVMGASKRIAEIYAQSLGKVVETKFVTTRFGNVLGSNGSVIPLFKKQIEKGGPVTVTDPEVTRFFMTIPEAARLVLEAGSKGNGGEIFIFDMGQPVKIYDLARKMIRLSGLTPGVDITIAFTGLRPGEKLYEELLNNEENTLPTHHKKILVAQVREYEYNVVKADIDELISLAQTADNFAVVTKMKQIVPEFISNNSEFGKIDKP